MMFLFEELDLINLQNKVNEWINNCGSEIDNIQFTTSVINGYVIVYHACVVTTLNLNK